MKKSFTVRIPASSGNLGPGFDVLGMALDLANEMKVEVLKAGPPIEIIVQGEGAGEIRTDSRNIIYQALVSVLKKAGKRVPSVRLTCVNRIPLARGLGSSSAAILAGLISGNELAGRRFSQKEILALANEIEGHPDNVASSLLGGVQASKVVGQHVETVAWPLPKVSFVAVVPDFYLPTERARRVVPKMFDRSQAVSNLASVALMQAAFLKQDLLRVVLDDLWHEPQRAALIPGFLKVRHAAIKAGAYGMTLSGAGPTLLAWAPAAKTKAIGRAMQKAFRANNVASKVLFLKPDTKGARVL